MNHVHRANPLSRLEAVLATLLLTFAFALPGCGASSESSSEAGGSDGSAPAEFVASSDTSAEYEASNAPEANAATSDSAAATLADIPEYSGCLSIDINSGVPGFTDRDMARSSFVDFSELDFEGRCGQAFALIGPETVTSAPRDDISDIHPSGWEQQGYDFVEGGVLYNRSHLIGHQLCGRDVAENLITGTRAFNAQGMLHYEDLVADYVHSTNNHVLYRVTPLYAAYDLVARGVQMEAKSVEDNGAAVQFNVFVYNVEPGVAIDYVTGKNWESDATPAVVSVAPDGATRNVKADGSSTNVDNSANASSPANTSNADETYVLNTSSKKFHRPTCSAVDDVSSKNKSGYSGSRDELIEEGYTPCKICNP